MKNCFNCTNEELSYIVGFIHADGWVYHNKHCNHSIVGIELKGSDINILDKIVNTLSEVKFSRNSRVRDTNFKKNSHQVSITTSNKDFVGLVSSTLPDKKKSDNVCAPTGEEWYIERDYMRGFFDGDGSVGLRSDRKSPIVSLCTRSESIKELFCATFSKVTGKRYEPKRNQRDNIYNIGASSKSAVLIADYLYNGAGIYLDRKYAKYKELLAWHK